MKKIYIKPNIEIYSIKKSNILLVASYNRGWARDREYVTPIYEDEDEEDEFKDLF